MLADETCLEILALYDQGWEPGEIADMLRMALSDVQEVLDADAEEFPDEPLRQNLVLH